MQQEEPLRNELFTEVESIAPILAEHAASSEKLGRLDEVSFEALRSTRLLRCVCPRALIQRFLRKLLKLSRLPPHRYPRHHLRRFRARSRPIRRLSIFKLDFCSRGTL